MSRYIGGHDITPILEVANYWREKCLQGNGSVFSNETLWTSEHMDELDKFYIQNYLEDKRSFYDKLEEQLNPASTGAKKLASEMTWVMLLFPYKISASRKLEDISRMWSWSGDELDHKNRFLQDALMSGVGHTGVAYNTLRWREFTFFIRLMQAWKKLKPSQQQNYLADPWEFASFLDSIEDADHRNLRHLLLYLIFPDYFERIAAVQHKRKIASVFGDQEQKYINKLSLLELDKKIYSIRQELENKYGTKDLDFYEPPLKELWQPKLIELPSNIAKEDVIKAIDEIDNSIIPSDAQSSTYDLIFQAKRYPPKFVLSLANKYANGEELDRALFEGGESTKAFKLLRDLGFIIERKDFVEKLVSQFINQADEAKNLSTAGYTSSYCDLKVNVSFGQGNYARIPWISFLGPGQKTQKGIYPGLLYYKAHGVLILTYGLSETNPPTINWQLPSDVKTINQYFNDEHGVKPDRYGNSYVYTAYKIPTELDVDKLSKDLDNIIWKYQQIFEGIELTHYWIFQANPDYFNLNKAIRERRERTWLINQSQKQIKKGQKGFLWLSGKNGGIVATGTTLTDPAMMEQNTEEHKYILQEDKFAGEQLRAVVGVDKVLKTPISRKFLLNHPVLKKLVILNFANATNYMIREEEYQAIMKIINSQEIEIDYTNKPYVMPPTIALKTGEEKPYSIDDALEGLFVERERFQEILDRFRAKKNIILQGPPGVGKTYFSKRMAWALMGFKAPNRLEMVQFHQSYSYEDFIQGFRPSGTGFELKDGVFFKFCKKASQDPYNKYVFIIDEINRGNLSKVFGELMMLIENDKRGSNWEMSLTYGNEGEKFYVPENLYIMGLMNTADRSLAMVDYALRRRFSFIDLEPGFETDAFNDFLISTGADQSLVDKIKRRMGEVNDKISKDTTNLGPGYCIGHSFFCSASNENKADEKWYQQVIKTEIAPLLKEYWFDEPGQADSLIKSLLND